MALKRSKVGVSARSRASGRKPSILMMTTYWVPGNGVAVGVGVGVSVGRPVAAASGVGVEARLATWTSVAVELGSGVIVVSGGG